jgi:hypothetical protein
VQSQDSSFDWENQFSIDASAFISETIPGTGVRLLRARPETEAVLAKQLEIPRRLELLRRQAPPHLTTARLAAVLHLLFERLKRLEERVGHLPFIPKRQ